MKYYHHLEYQLSNNTEVILPFNKNIEDFILNVNGLWIDNKLIYDKNKILAKEIGWFLKDKDKNTKFISKIFILSCKYNNESILLKIGNSVYEKIFYNYRKDISYKLIINYKKVNNMFINYDDSKLIQCDDKYIIDNDDINILYKKYIESNYLNIEDKHSKDIINKYLYQYKTNYNFFYKKIRKHKLNKIIND